MVSDPSDLVGVTEDADYMQWVSGPSRPLMLGQCPL